MRKRRIKRRIVTGFLMILVAITFFFVGKETNKKTSSENTMPSHYQEVYEKIQAEWLNYNHVDEIDERMLKGMVNSLNDPFTEYLSPTEANAFNESMQSSMNGIGIMVNENLMIEHVQIDSPAEYEKIQKGDQIIEVNHQKVKSRDELAAVLTHIEGDQIHISILRAGRIYYYELPLEKLDSSMIYDTFEADDLTYGYLAILSFSSDTATNVGKALKYFQKHNIQNIVIDLRDNLGGYVESAISCLEYFLPEGTLLCTLEQKNGNHKDFYSDKKEQYKFVNGYILVNGYTASAAEIFAGCLQETLEYQLVGSQTYGKGIAQDFITFSDLSVLKYTFAAWLLPSGDNIQGNGLSPNQEMELESLSEIIMM